MNIDVKAVADKITGGKVSSAEEFRMLEESKRAEALAYLRLKFPGTDERAFFTDYTGRVFGDILHFRAVAEAAVPNPGVSQGEKQPSHSQNRGKSQRVQLSRCAMDERISLQV